MKIIGIDPGKQTGFALVENSKILIIETTDFWGAIDRLIEYQDAFVVIEKSVSTHVWHDGATAKNAVLKTGFNVGTVLDKTDLMIEWLVRNNRRFLIKKPQGKVSSAYFSKIVGYNKRTSQHARDAAMLALSVNPKQIK